MYYTVTHLITTIITYQEMIPHISLTHNPVTACPCNHVGPNIHIWNNKNICSQYILVFYICCDHMIQLTCTGLCSTVHTSLCGAKIYQPIYKKNITLCRISVGQFPELPIPTSEVSIFLALMAYSVWHFNPLYVSYQLVKGTLPVEICWILFGIPNKHLNLSRV